MMPVLFMGHGSPMNAVEDNEYTRVWRKIAKDIQKPKAILCISAHWLTKGTYVCTADPPGTIYDFGGFPEHLYTLKYGCPGSPSLAREISEKVQGFSIGKTEDWGLDHGTWEILIQMYPKADIPVLQMSINYEKDNADYHYRLGQALRFLREEGVLILASGNIVHNLGTIRFNDKSGYPWAETFDSTVEKLILERNIKSLNSWRTLGDAALKSVPSPDHYYPLMYILGASSEKDKISFPVKGLTMGSISMRSVMFS